MPKRTKIPPCDEQMAAFLPEALRQVLESYNKYAARLALENNDDFSKDHADCKMAVTHIELLLKLAERAKDLAGDKETRKAMTAITKRARKAHDDHVRQYPEDWIA